MFWGRGGKHQTFKVSDLMHVEWQLLCHTHFNVREGARGVASPIQLEPYCVRYMGRMLPKMGVGMR
jgi:hypothetical protein